MRQELNSVDLEQVVGGTVRLNTTRMRIGFTVLNQAFNLKNCEDYQAMGLVAELYGKYKNEGDRAFEEATLAAFRAKGWIDG